MRVPHVRGPFFSMTGMSNICGESPRGGVVADEPQSDLQVSRGDSRERRSNSEIVA